MIDVRRLRVLRGLADHGTITAAASSLHLTPSAVSQQIAALSREAGVRLVEPDGRKVRLTEAAYVLLDHAHRVFAQLEHAQADLARHVAGEQRALRIGAFASALAFLVAPAVGALRGGDDPIRLDTVDVDGPSAYTRLASGELDLVVGVETPAAPQQDDPRFYRQPLLRDELYAVLPTEHRLSSRDSVRLDSLAAEDWVIGPAGSTCFEITQMACTTAGFTPRTVHATSDWPAVGALIATGRGVALVPALALNLLPPDVCAVPITGRTLARHVFAVTRRGAHEAPSLVRVLSALTASAEQIAGR